MSNQAELPLPKAAQPRFQPAWDAWNSSSTGHQRAETRPGTGWRDSRNHKLNIQFRAGGKGGERIYDTPMSGALGWAEGKKTGPSVMEMLTRPGAMRQSGNQHNDDSVAHKTRPASTGKESSMPGSSDRAQHVCQSGVLSGVVIFVNGSTFPLISDHKLKQVITENGGQLSMHLGRQKVTHVVLGRPAGSGYGGGGGLAGGKVDKEIKKMRGSGIKFVGVEWVLESLQAGKRLPEAGFSNTKIASKGQGSVYGLFSGRQTSASRGTTT